MAVLSRAHQAYVARARVGGQVDLRAISIDSITDHGHVVR